MNGILAIILSGISFGSILFSDTTTADGFPIWLWRAFISLCIAIIGILLKRMLDEAKEENEKRDKHLIKHDTEVEKLIKITGAHEVMYEFWLDNLIDESPIPEGGRRKTDRLARILQKLSEERKND